MTGARWRRAEAVAHTDDGQRVVVLNLDEPEVGPRLLAGSAAAVWRALEEPRTTRELADLVGGGAGQGADAEVVEDVQAFLEALHGEGLTKPRPTT
jgi:hypothetical protein